MFIHLFIQHSDAEDAEVNKNNILALEGTLPIVGETGNRHHTKDKVTGNGRKSGAGDGG